MKHTQHHRRRKTNQAFVKKAPALAGAFRFQKKIKNISDIFSFVILLALVVGIFYGADDYLELALVIIEVSKRAGLFLLKRV
ncbi:hypothetical protein KKC60_02950 [Patescibacteria group bacterium]|nr:hypothetical protein [Patescibacteria group bacterium]